MKNQLQTLNCSANNKPFQTQFIEVFNKIVSIEQELDTLRQLLNEQISFNLKDLYVIVAGTSSAVNYRHLLTFLKESTLEGQKQNSIQTILQAIIRFYNTNTSLNLSFGQFSSIFLNRQNRLLMKMTLERESIGTLPNYILNYSRKIISKQVQLHFFLLQFRTNCSSSASTLIESLLTTDQRLDQRKTVNYICQLSGKVPQKINVQLDIFKRYLKPFSQDLIQKQLLESLLVNTNAETVTQFLKQKPKKKNHKVGIRSSSLDKQIQFSDPFVRSQFHDCLARPKVTDMFSYREVKSIQKHMDRLNLTIQNSKEEINSKLKKFESIIQKSCEKVLQAIKDIIWLQKQIEYSRVELSLCPDFYPVLFFQCFHKDKLNRIIPSAMEIYFKQFGIRIPLNQIYLLFKRYAWHLQGKMEFNAFCSMFDVCETAYSRIQKNRQIKSLADVDVSTKKNFLILLATIIKNEKKIDTIKSKLQKSKNMNLRDVFACFDTDEDGYLSITDFRVVWKKYYNLEISKQMIHLLWFRMGYANQNQIVRYEEFMKQMVPKSSSAVIQDRKLRKIKSQSILKFRNKQNTKKIK